MLSNKKVHVNFTSMARPIALVIKIMYVVSLSRRYRKITVWKKRLTSIA